MGRLYHFRKVVLVTTLGNNLYMQIRSAFVENSIFCFLIKFATNQDNWAKLVSKAIFSWSRNTIEV